MDARASGVEPQDETDALARIEGRLNTNRRRGLVLAGAAAAVFVVAGALVLLARGDDKQQVNLGTDSSSSPTSATSTTSGPVITATTLAPTTSSTATTEPGPTTTLPASFPHVWPLDAAGGFATPADATHSFFAGYLGMTQEQLGATTLDPSGRATVEGFARGPGSARTVVGLVQTTNGWVVIGANADQIVVDDPLPFGGVSHPMHVSGQSVAFEAQLGLELRSGGSMTVVATGTAMGGSSEMQPFDTTISPPAGDGPFVLLVFEGDASGAQSYSKVTVVLIGVGQQVDASASASS
jgi:hypothetical protein